MIGQVVDSRYEIVELLGQGGMGSVYEAQDVETGRRVALKRVSAEIIAKSAVLAARFQREAKASAAVVSEHIVQVLDAGLDAPSGQPYMVMELLRGENVRTLLRRVGALPPQLAVRIGVQTCMGLHKAHEGGVVHRDIKPANLFLTQGEGNRLVVKLLDFGVAKVKMDQVDGADAEALTRTGSLLGSPLYMSPEQARGLKTIDHRADLWSLGVVLYQLLSRRAPLEGIESLGGLIVSICSDEPAPLRQHAPWVPPKLAEVVHGALKLDPARRFQTAAQMLDALRGCLVGTPEIHSGMLVGLSEQQRTAMAAQHESGAPGEGGQAATIALDGSADLIVLEPGAAAAAAEPAAGRDGTVVLAEPALPAP
ncbi:MAG: serine/threonine protein kinase, partial [Deltaproteobacteria bacterium]|nr:serine/threonine protein kinase [Deltaproteobacteria bacterium]